jgi:hypothetical protein
VTIHASSLLEGNVLGSVIGVSEKLEAGTTENVEVTLFSGVSDANFEMSVLQETQKLIAMPHLDTNGNGTCDFITSGGKKTACTQQMAKRSSMSAASTCEEVTLSSHSRLSGATKHIPQSLQQPARTLTSRQRMREL